jgi:hypothetical protein
VKSTNCLHTQFVFSLSPFFSPLGCLCRREADKTASSARKSSANGGAKEKSKTKPKHSDSGVLISVTEHRTGKEKRFPSLEVSLMSLTALISLVRLVRPMRIMS